MATIVCAGCKAEIPETAEFCAECGYIVKSRAPEKCPECSSMVVFTSDACPECGFPRELLGETPEPAGNSDENENEPVATTEELQQEYETCQPATETPVTGSSGNVTSDDVEISNAKIAEISELLHAQIESLNNLFTIISSVTGNYEKANTELINKLKEQNLLTLSGMQEVLSKFTAEFSKDSKILEQANATSTEEVKSIAAQAKDQLLKFASKISYKAGNTIDYTFYICGAMLIFTLVNLFVTAYIVRLIK